MANNNNNNHDEDDDDDDDDALICALVDVSRALCYRIHFGATADSCVMY